MTQRKILKQDNLYLGRRNDGEYEIGDGPNHWKDDRGFNELYFYLLLCHKDFEEIVGIELRAPSKPQKIKVKIELAT